MALGKGQYSDGEEMTRAYSIASPPSENGHVAFCLNRVQDGFMSNYLCSLGEGATITFQGPFGDFILRPLLRDTVFIATGTGIAPFRSMLPWLLAQATVIADASSGCSSERAASRTFTIARSLNVLPPNTPTFIFCPR